LEASLPRRGGGRRPKCRGGGTAAASHFTPFQLSSISPLQCTALVDALPGKTGIVNAHCLPRLRRRLVLVCMDIMYWLRSLVCANHRAYPAPPLLPIRMWLASLCVILPAYPLMPLHPVRDPTWPRPLGNLMMGVFRDCLPGSSFSPSSSHYVLHLRLDAGDPL
jgi:hypothetical protein